MDLCTIEDVVANNSLVNAKSDTSSRKKWIKKLHFPDDTVCDGVQKQLNDELNRTAPPSALSDQARKLEHEFSQLCQVQAIGQKMFREYCVQADQDIQNASNFVEDVYNWEVAPNEERNQRLRDLIRDYVRTGGSKLVKCIAEERRSMLESVVENQDYGGGSKGLQDNDLKLAKSVLDQCKIEANTYMKNEAFSKYKQSHFYKTFLKWKHIEQESVTEECFTPFRLLGRGGFGEVYAYQVKMTGFMYACKKIDKKRMKMKTAESVVLLEKVILEKVNSRFVVNLAYAFESKDCLNLVMTLMGGGDLKYHIYSVDKRNKGVNPKRCKMYAAQIILGLHHLHEENILYRDMKPENVLLDDVGNCRIADLGLAHILKEDEKIVGRAGTVGYMAPEMLQQNPYAYSVDWFALGCTMFEMCEGRGPFNVKDKAKRKLNQEFTIRKTIEDPEEFLRDHDAELVDIIRQLLAKQVEDRLSADDKSSLPIRNHAYFSDVNWERLEAGMVPPPFVPDKNQVYAQDVSNIKLASDVKGVKIEEPDRQFYQKFATGRIPAAWQKEIIESGVYQEITDRNESGSGNVGQTKSKMCSII